MTENKRFIPIFDGFDKRVVGAKDNGRIISFMDMFDLLNELYEEKEFWKSNCCSQDNFNRILLNELSIAQEQGYKLSDPFKKLMEEKEDL